METKGFFQFEIVTKDLVSSFRFIWIPMLSIYCNYKFLSSIFRAGILTSIADVSFWRLKTVPALKVLIGSFFLDSVTIFMKFQLLVVLRTLDSEHKNELLRPLNCMEKVPYNSVFQNDRYLSRTNMNYLWSYFDKQKVIPFFTFIFALSKFLPLKV